MAETPFGSDLNPGLGRAYSNLKLGADRIDQWAMEKGEVARDYYKQKGRDIARKVSRKRSSKSR